MEQFQSTPSVWRETCPCHLAAGTRQFQSTPSVWRETAAVFYRRRGALISIHSLRVEGDYRVRGLLDNFVHFNPLPPCGGRLCRGSSAI